MNVPQLGELGGEIMLWQNLGCQRNASSLVKGNER